VEKDVALDEHVRKLEWSEEIYLLALADLLLRLLLLPLRIDVLQASSQGM
jgi:hypothetical protein